VVSDIPDHSFPSVTDLQAAVVGRDNLVAAATAFASELATGLQCERVSVGFVENRFSRIVAISHGGSPTDETELLVLLGNAMDEAIEQRATVRYPALADAPPRIVLAHQSIQRRQGGGICTVPLVTGGEIVGAVLFEFRDEARFEHACITACEHLISLVGPVLELMRRNERPWRQQLGAVIHDLRLRLNSPENKRLRLLALLAGATIFILLFIPFKYHVGGQARIEGAVQRILVAPADGYLKQAFVRPGDEVKAGQVLVEMAEQDLQIERRKWSSELVQHENAYATALARADRAQLVINQARADEAKAQLDLIEQQLGRARIEAPFAGIIIKGDLSQSLGAPLQRGDVLLTLAPRDQYRIIVEVDERDISRVNIGSKGYLALSALPWDTLPLTVSRITPMASAVEGGNVFEVEAALDSPPENLKPGLQGVAKIEAGRQPLIWGWTHRAINWLRLKIWAWWGI
jgi:biotin carboxyl carrier protein